MTTQQKTTDTGPAPEPDEQGRTGDGAAETDAAPETPPADEPETAPADEPVAPDEDVVATRAENERLRRELEEHKARDAARQEAEKPKPPAPKRKAEKPAPEAAPPAKRRRRVSRFLGDHYSDED
jgi:hypothetical protein